MSDSQEGRNVGRGLTELPLALEDEKGNMLDEHAAAHDVSVKGFRIETHVELAPGQIVVYRLSLSEGRHVRGRAKIAWSQRTDFGLWAGAEFLALSWSEKRLIKRVFQAPTADWMLIAMKIFFAVFWITIILALWYGLRSPFWRPQLLWLAPKAVAAVAMGWALRVLLSWDD